MSEPIISILVKQFEGATLELNKALLKAENLEAENAKLKAELVKERECVDFYADTHNAKGLEIVEFQGVLGFGDPIGDRARQRQKERDQSILKDSNEVN